jgi:hypothetical protein
MAKQTKPSRTKVRKRRTRARHYIVRLDTFEGEDTACYLLGADPMWIVMAASPAEGASIVDCGYRSLEEAREAWPEAVLPPRSRRSGPRLLDAYRPVFSEPWFQEFWKRMKRVLVEGRERAW